MAAVATALFDLAAKYAEAVEEVGARNNLRSGRSS
jgi:hypothetical protein